MQSLGKVGDSHFAIEPTTSMAAASAANWRSLVWAMLPKGRSSFGNASR